MMHVQLINESQYNKEHKIKIHSLCFYYRNHKHVLYGSFTINNEVFIFSFNIFDIYRSYHSKSNKKSSKSHKNATTVNLQAVKTSTKTATIPTSTTTVPQMNFNTANTSNKLFGIDDSNKNSNEFTTYINDIVKSSLEEASKTPAVSSELTDSTLISAPDLALTKTEKILIKLEAISQNKVATNVPSKTTQAAASKPVNSSNLSNFLVVRFETCTNQESTSSSKTKNKYKKCIKIVSVSSKPLSYFDSTSSQTVSDIQLKTFEFTEKCLSFRLACLDFNSENRTNFDVKIINLYEKYLCAAVNFKLEDQESSFKLFKIKHEESASTITTIGSEQKLTSKLSSTEVVNATPDSVSSSQTLPVLNCLIATSSSRLNLTEFVLNCFTASNLNTKILAILPITVTTFDDEDDLHFIALLNDLGVISIIDPVKNCIVMEFNSLATDNKFVHMTYCYGLLQFYLNPYF